MTALAAVLAILLGGFGCYCVVIVRSRRKQFDSLTLPDVRNWIEILLKRGRDGGFIIITDIPSGKFVQIKKYVRRTGDYGLRMDFPKAPWSLAHYDAVSDVLQKDAVSFSALPTDDDPVTEVIVVDFHRDTGLALAVVERILFDVFGLPRDRRFRLRGEDISYKDEVIDTPSDT